MEATMAQRALHLPFPFPLASSSSSSSSSFSLSSPCCYLEHGAGMGYISFRHPQLSAYGDSVHYPCGGGRGRGRGNNSRLLLNVAGEDSTQLQFTSCSNDEQQSDSQDLEYVNQIQRVLGLLKSNRDMLFSEVKLTIMIEDPREVERRRLLGIEDADTPTREDLATALEEVNEGKVPENRAALRMLAEEMIQWPNLEFEPPKKKRGKSLYAKATDTGIDPREAAKRLNIDWDSAAEIEDTEASDDPEVPAVLGYGALYLVTAFPVIIGISVVLILFYNSLQ